MNSDIQNATINLGQAIHTGIISSSDDLRTKVQLKNTELLDTMTLIYSDLFSELVKDPTHKLFYLKSRIDELSNGRTLTDSQFNYLTILQSELDKLNKEHKL